MEHAQDLYPIVSNSIGDDVGRSNDHALARPSHAARAPHARKVGEGADRVIDLFRQRTGGNWIVRQNVINDRQKIVPGFS